MARTGYFGVGIDQSRRDHTNSFLDRSDLGVKKEDALQFQRNAYLAFNPLGYVFPIEGEV